MRRFWFLQLLLILLAVAAPVGAILYFDARAAVAASETHAEQQLRNAEGRLSLALDRAAELRLSQAIVSAAKLSARDSLGRLDSRAEETEATALKKELKALAPAGGFALLVDAGGSVLAGSPATSPAGAELGAHPLFRRALMGEASFGLWQPGVFAAVAPVAEEGRAAGAVIIGGAPDQAEVERLAKEAGAAVTVAQNKELVLSTLPKAEATPLVSAMLPTLSGARAEPLPGLGPLPLFIDRKLSGRALRTGEVSQRPGAAQRWLVSVPVGAELTELLSYQKQVLLIALGVALLTLLFGLIQSRLFVRSIGKIEEHLSNVTRGGDMELPEVRVTAPFRRMVRLINMIVQKGQRPVGMSTVPAGELSRLRGATPAPIPSAVDGLSLTPAPAPADIIPSADLLKLGGPSSGIDAFAPLKSAAAAVPPNDEHAAAIADAINSLNEAESTSGVSSVPPQVRSAAEIRGTLMGDDAGPRGGGSLNEEGGRPGSDLNSTFGDDDPDHREKTVVATVSPDLLAQSAEGAGLDEHPATLTQAKAPQLDDGLDDADRAHFREVYDRFIDMRRRCGENTGDLSYDRFAQKLMKNRAALIEKYACRTVRFQVHEKNGKAALKATPVRSKS